MGSTIMWVRPGDSAFGAAAELFDDYRVHFGQDPDPVRSAEWLSEQARSGALRVAAVVLSPGAADPALRVAGGADPAVRVAGVLTAAVLPASLRLGSFWFVRDLFVRPDHRRAGVAQALLDHVIAEARAAGATRISLQTEPHNAPALALYTAAGFQPVEGVTSLNLTLS